MSKVIAIPPVFSTFKTVKDRVCRLLEYRRIQRKLLVITVQYTDVNPLEPKTTASGTGVEKCSY